MQIVEKAGEDARKRSAVTTDLPNGGTFSTCDAWVPVPSASAAATFDVERVRADFPILSRQIGGHALAYLDNGASAQKPLCVIETLNRYYREHHANIHRGVHRLGEEATSAYEHARESVARFLNAASSRECVFTRGTTESVNLVAATWGRANLREGDEILLSTMEHHANIVPWQEVAAQTGAGIRVLPLLPDGSLDIEAFHKSLSPRVKLLAITHASNVLGTVNPVRELAAAAHEVGARVFVDGAQSAAHFPVDVRALDVDFFAFSSHKVCGPTGVGVLYGKAEILNAMPPYQFGGDMIRVVDFSGTTYREIPERFEAGTPSIADAIALGVALDYITSLRPGAMHHEESLLRRATDALSAIPGLRILGTASEKVAVLSFVMDKVHPLDAGTLLDADGIAVRTGHHCAMPLMKTLGLQGTIRASFAFYNTHEEVDRLAASLRRIRGMF
ncbi:MAG: cysteine desulfurase [Puniceicoccales bacterium]|jgi:cysteine desulfurase/selenocysteine lyase|nr:cysteine desulfurase [Puniceicoccales bacterium]